MKKNKPAHLLARDQAQGEVILLLGQWKELEIRYSDSIRRIVLTAEVVEGVVSKCIHYGLFEEARVAARFRQERGLKIAEVDEALKALLLKFTPYTSLSNQEAEFLGKEFDHHGIFSYPPFAELLQATSDEFREFIERECLYEPL